MPRRRHAAPAPRLSSSIRVRLEPEQRLALERLAVEAGMPVSMLVRGLIRTHLRKVREGERS